MKNIPICFFPTKGLLIDDNSSFLELLSADLLNDDNHHILFKSPIEALDYINNKYKADPYTNRHIQEVDGNSFQERALSIDLYQFPSEVYNKERFNQISYIVVDYDMPEMNGLELCSKIKDPLIQKILLTGAADDHLAVEAFNKGLIHQFINKSDANMNKKVNQAIAEAKDKYFKILSDIIANIIAVRQLYKTAIGDPKFLEMFYSLVDKHNIAEYYIFEDNGSFLMIDDKGKIYGLFTYPESEVIDMADELIEDENIDLDKKTLKALQNRDKIFCYHQSQSITSGGKGFPPMSERVKYLRDAKKIELASGVYYYAFTDDIMDINRDNILSFKDFRDNTYADI